MNEDFLAGGMGRRGHYANGIVQPSISCVRGAFDAFRTRAELWFRKNKERVLSFHMRIGKEGCRLDMRGESGIICHHPFRTRALRFCLGRIGKAYCVSMSSAEKG